MASAMRQNVPERPPMAVLKMIDSRHFYTALKALEFHEKCLVDISKSGLRIVVNDQNCIQGIAYLNRELFAEYFLIRDEDIIFGIPLYVFMESINAFGTGVMGMLKLIYDGPGLPFKIMLERDGVVLRSLIDTRNPEEILDFDFNPISPAARVIMKPEMLQEAFRELDQSSLSVEFMINPFSLNIITKGDLGVIQVEFPAHSEQMEQLDCRHKVEYSYKLCLLKRVIPSLNMCSKLSIRIDHRGILSMQFIIERYDNTLIFLEFYCIPEIPTSEEENGTD
ncbi:unnamed protein product [Thelazia callipaeda]|uniref:Cell cycle checkpoint protein RAD1 n=1 Tax=Thelazia callipaeda TaxID=103827 RepID=A0A0N5D4L4_THECL|nr:unnamed protein product [Thelazia callipaeda]